MIHRRGLNILRSHCVSLFSSEPFSLKYLIPPQLNRFGWIPSDHIVRWNVLCNNRSSTYDCALPYRDPHENLGSGTDPGILFDRNLFCNESLLVHGFSRILINMVKIYNIIMRRN